MDVSVVESQLLEIDKLHKNGFEYEKMISLLKNLTEMMKIHHFRYEINETHYERIAVIIKAGIEILVKSDIKANDIDFLAELFRFLRNSCAGFLRNEHGIFSSNIIHDFAKVAIQRFMQEDSEKEIIILRCCLQMYGNLVCCDIKFKYLVWSIFLDEDLFMKCFLHKDLKVQEYAIMVFYNCMVDEHLSYVIDSSKGHDMLIVLTNLLCNNLVDWGILFLELLLKRENFTQKCYEILPDRNRLLILDLIIDTLNSFQQDQDSVIIVHRSIIDFFKEQYINYVMNIMKVCNADFPTYKAAEIVKILCLLCAASVSDHFCNLLRPCKDLLEISIDVLKSIHLLGKKSDNVFTTVSSLKVSDQISKEEIEAHPSYSFKKNLIRLIGNLSYCCKENQDLIRKLDGIPLLLDCCNIDVRNPFIMQWCILAIRNILENNAENQAILAEISVSGDLVDSVLLKELGFQVCNENGKFVLRTNNSVM